MPLKLNKEKEGQRDGHIYFLVIIFKCERGLLSYNLMYPKENLSIT